MLGQDLASAEAGYPLYAARVHRATEPGYMHDPKDQWRKIQGLWACNGCRQRQRYGAISPVKNVQRTVRIARPDTDEIRHLQARLKLRQLRDEYRGKDEPGQSEARGSLLGCPAELAPAQAVITSPRTSASQVSTPATYL